MRPLSFAFAASALLLASNAYAQSSNYPMTDQPPISTVQVTAQDRGFRIWDYQAEEVSGTYALSNGWRMNVQPASNGITVKLDNRHPIRLVALSPDKFVSRDGNISMEFNRGPDRDGMMMSYVPDVPLADVIVATATMAQR